MTPQLGETVWYRNSDSGHVYEGVFVGETSRSWLVGGPEEWWLKLPDMFGKCAKKLPKKSTTFVSKADADLHQWAAANRYQISQQVHYLEDGAVLKKIADLIGYTEKKV